MSEDWYYDWAKNTLLWAKSALNVPNMSEMNQCEHSLSFFGLATVILVNQSPKRESNGATTYTILFTKEDSYII